MVQRKFRRSGVREIRQKVKLSTKENVLTMYIKTLCYPFFTLQISAVYKPPQLLPQKKKKKTVSALICIGCNLMNFIICACLLVEWVPIRRTGKKKIGVQICGSCMLTIIYIKYNLTMNTSRQLILENEFSYKLKQYISCSNNPIMCAKHCFIFSYKLKLLIPSWQKQTAVVVGLFFLNPIMCNPIPIIKQKP